MKSAKDIDPIVGNCSVYSLAGGLIRFQDYNGTWLDNYTTQFLPAYYTTNCSVGNLSAVLDEYFNSQQSWKQWTDGLAPPFSQRDNGDAFVALLFTLSGVCVSLWMLTLLLYLLPRHKRKPVLTQLTTVFSSVVCTVLLTQVTEAACDEYYSDTLDIFVFREVMFRTPAYRVCTVIAVLLVHVSRLQMVMRITRLGFRYAMAAAGGALIVVFTVMHGVFEIRFDDADAVVDGPGNSELASLYAWRASLVAVQLVLQAWFMAAVFKFTFVDKDPRKISYALPTLVLGLFTWGLLFAIFVVDLLSVTTFRHQWWVRLWLDRLPMLLDVALLTIAWEWIYNIGQLEKKHELIGVLGRRMSSDDVASNPGAPRAAWWRRTLWPAKWLVSPSQSSSPSEPVEIHQSDQIGQTGQTGQIGQTGQTNQTNQTGQSDQSDTNYSNYNVPILHPTDPVPPPRSAPHAIPDLHTAAGSVNSGSTISYNVSMASSSSSSAAAPAAAPAADSQPPPFVPHPGYSRDDYWHEKS